jgi:uncharacterized protein (TIGR00369 family)
MNLENPLLESLGVHLAGWEIGRAEFQLEIEGRHLNRQGVLQGGVTATLLDAACGYAGLQTESGGLPGNSVTVMLTASYLDKVDRGRLRALGRVTRAGGRLYFAAGEVIAEDGRLIATAQGTFQRSD